MTYDQFKYYLKDPFQFLDWKVAQIKLWNMKRKARKAAQVRMRDLRQLEENLRAAADPCCAKCYGQGHKGFNLTHKTWEVCRCTYNPRTAEKCEEKPWLRC